MGAPCLLLTLLSESIWGFPKIRGPFLGVPIKRTTVFWGLYSGPPILGNYHITWSYNPSTMQVSCAQDLMGLGLRSGNGCGFMAVKGCQGLGFVDVV